MDLIVKSIKRTVSEVLVNLGIDQVIMWIPDNQAKENLPDQPAPCPGTVR